MTQTETETETFDKVHNAHVCKICGNGFSCPSQITAWEIHKLNHTLVALKNIIDRAIAHGDRLY